MNDDLKIIFELIGLAASLYGIKILAQSHNPEAHKYAWVFVLTTAIFGLCLLVRAIRHLFTAK